MLRQYVKKKKMQDVTYMWNLKAITGEYNKKETGSQIE